jgi:uroporphyrinogen-III synthase
LTRAHTLLLTRPQAQAERFALAARSRLGVLNVVISPLIEIVPRSKVVVPKGVAGLIFTSENGLAAFAALSARRGLPVWCVGGRTAAAARAAGFDRVRSAGPAGGDAEALLRLLLADAPRGPLLHLRGAHARGDLAARLTAAGLPCDEAVIYDQRALGLNAPARAALSGAGTVLLPLFSPRSVRLFLDDCGVVGARLVPVAISSAAAAPWQAVRPEPVTVAARPDAAAMLDALAAAATRLRLEGEGRKG